MKAKPPHTYYIHINRLHLTLLVSMFNVMFQGYTPLMYAVEGGHLETVKELMKNTFLKYNSEVKVRIHLCIVKNAL